jgi:hypothetical protein
MYTSNRDWARNPWFVEPNDELEAVYRQMGFPLAIRRKISSALARIYTPEFFDQLNGEYESQLSKTRPRMRLLGMARDLGAACWWPGRIVPLLDVGFDLHVAEPWSADYEELRIKLRLDGEFQSAALELRVLANLMHFGAQVSPIKRLQDKTPDLRLEDGGRIFEVEIKQAHGADRDRLADDLEGQLRSCVDPLPGIHLRLEASAEVAAQAEQRGHLDTDEINAFVRRVSETKSSPRGWYRVGNLGRIGLEAGPPLGSITAKVLGEPTPLERAKKVGRLVRTALSQFSGGSGGIVVVGVDHAAEIPAAAALLEQDLPRLGPIDRCRMVVLCDHARLNDGTYRSVPLVWPVPVSGGPLDAYEKDLARILAARHGEPAHFADRVPLHMLPSAQRPRVTLVVTDRTEWTANAVTSLSMQVPPLPNDPLDDDDTEQ